MHVCGRYLARPAQAELVDRVFGDRSDRAGGADTIGAHRHGDQLAVDVEHLQAERFGVLLPELEDVTHLDAARGLQDPAVTPGAGVAVTHFGDLDQTVGSKVAPGHQTGHMLAGLVGTGHPTAALNHSRVEQIAHLGGLGLPERNGADIALGQGRTLGEVGIGEGLEDRPLPQISLQALGVDLAIAGQTDRQGLMAAVGIAHREDHILQGVCRSPLAAALGEALVEQVDERLDRRGVGGVLHTRGGQIGVRNRGLERHRDRLDIGCIVTDRAAHIGVFTDIGLGQELLRLRAAHRPAHRLHDHVVEAEPVEDLDIGPAVGLV